MEKKYDSVLKHLVDKINGSRQKIARVVNNELLSAYWEIGRTLLEQKEKEGWGKKIIERLAKDLKAEFPQMNGLSERNLKYMQAFAAAWPYFPFVQPPVAQLAGSGQNVENPITQPSAARLTESGQNVENPIVQPLVAQLQTAENQATIVRRPLLALIPWVHHLIILNKVKSEEERIFYIIKVIENTWSKNILIANIETNLYSRIGKAITNFDSTLSKNEAELVRLTLKNPYMFDFLGIEGEVKELELERALIKHIQKFLLEIGKGFALVGNQYTVKVENDEFVIDLLFFNFNLNCFVVFELKIGGFKPEYAGKLNFYINVIDAQLKGSAHKPTIGVLLCKTPNNTVVKYSLQGVNSPLGVAEYELLPKQLKAAMPTMEQLERELAKEMEGMPDPENEKKDKLKETLVRLKGKAN